MRCTHCDYSLWNTPAGPCPECGTGFKPSDFRFRANAVRFLCPHCGQDYYGTDDRGHLVPREFSCARCGAGLDMDAMRLLPTEGVTEKITGQYVNPWVDGESGRVGRFVRTARDGASKPDAVIRGTPTVTGKGPAARFVLSVFAVAALMGVGPIAALPLVFGGWGGGTAVLSLLTGLAFAVGAAFVVPFVLYLLWVSLTFVVLRVGSKGGPAFGRTVQAMSYTAGPMLLIAVPLIGPYLLWMVAVPWWIVCAIIALRVGTGARVWRCVVGVLVLPGVVVGLMAAGYVSLLASLAAAAAMGPARAGVGAGMPAASAASAVVTLDAAWGTATMDSGRAPLHAAELMHRQLTTPSDFALSFSATNPYALPMGNIDALTWTSTAPDERRVVLDAMIADLPVGAFAHRFGDFVFVTDVASVPRTSAGRGGGLWRIIASFDPDSNGPGPDPIVVADTLGGYSSYAAVDFAAALAAQNADRASLGLPPLPDPALITHGAPAVAAPR